MSKRALATDFDGTIAKSGKVSDTTYSTLQRWQQTGRALIMVTGRLLDNLYDVFPQAKTFDWGATRKSWFFAERSPS